MMSRKIYKPREILAKLREVEILTSQGNSVVDAIRAIGVTDATYYQWRQEYDGLSAAAASHERQWRANQNTTPGLDPPEKATKFVIEFDTLAEAVPQIVWITGPDGKNIYFNKQWEDYTGLTVEEGHGHGWNIPFHPDDRQRAWEAWKHAWQTDGIYSLECRLRGADGNYRWWLIRGSALHDEKGTIINWYGTWTDVEDIKQTEEALKRARDEAEATNEKLQTAYDEIRNLYEKTKALNQFKTQMFANVSHELRTPLTLILAPIENLLSMGLPEEATERLKLAQRNARGLLKQINDLLDVARLEAGKTTVTYYETDLAKITKHIASSFEIPAKEKHIQFSVITPSSMPAQIDTEKFERIVVNLLSNAFKFTPEGGAIQCQVHEDLGHFAVIEVGDSGPGVPEAFRDSVFEQFFQIPGSTRFGGTGLGLSIVKEFVEVQHGRVTVGRSPGGGALFKIEIPTKAPEEARVIRRSDGVLTAPSFVEESLPPTRRKKSQQTGAHGSAEGFSEPEQRKSLILVVEDNPDMREYICETLGPDVEIETAENGREGLDKARALMPDLIVSDIMMPEMGGDEMFRKMRSNPELEAIPFILVTAKADEELRIELLREGAIEYLIKPFMPEELKAKARSFLEAKSREVKYRQLMDSAQVDVGTVVKASQAVSGEIELGKLIELLLKIAVEHAGAERGLLILFRSNKLWLEAEATTGNGGVEVTVRKAEVTPADLPESLLHHVIETRESVILDDAAAPTLFSADAYVQQRRPRSVLCLPLVKQANLVGALYLENNLTPRVFTPNLLAVLEVLASQAAISLENARLYAELQVSENRWRNLFEIVPVGVALTGSHGRYVAANPAFQRMTGYSEAELRSCSPADITHEDDRAATEAIITARAAGEPYTRCIEKRYRRKDGGVTWAEVSAIPVPVAGATPLFAGVAVDITDRKRAEDDLRRSEASLTEAQQISHTGSWRWKVSTGEVSWSPEHFHIFAFDPATTQSSYAAFAERIHAEDRPSFEQALERSVRERSPFAHEYRIVLPDGSVKYLQSVGRPDMTGSGDLEFVGTVMDITERRLVDEALRSAQAELARVARLTTVGEFTASLAHEIRQPLAAIITNAETGLRWLSRQTPNLDETRQSMELIIKDGNRASKVIQGLRALVKKAEPQLAKLDIRDAIEEVLDLIRGELRRHGVVLHTDLSAGDRPVLGDRVQLQQVLLNLIMNGIQAVGPISDRRKELTVSVACTEPSRFLVAVEDTGPGLDPAIAQRIFEPFFTTKPDGLGMGLSICRSIVEAHGGHLWASPHAPHGTALRFTIPIAVEV
jgi:PAS domain S-box-containing protein